MHKSFIRVQGAREHNLKNIDVTIPRDSLTIITGLSGSGKSSLAFDTIYAEGQRRYVESLSAYARQFLEQMQKPEVDHIEGLSPAISIEQRTAGSNPRSIVATTTEIHDYLRLLYASIGKAHCWKCGDPITKQSAEEIADRIRALPAGRKIMLLAPLIRGQKGVHEDIIEAARKQGFTRVRIDGEVAEFDKLPKLDKNKKHHIEAVVDRLVTSASMGARLGDSVELALKTGGGILLLLEEKAGKWEETLYSEHNACLKCGLSFDTLTARHFSFNSPYGACPTCHGLGVMEVFDEELLVPEPDRSLDDGAVEPWRRGGRRLMMWYKKLLRGICAHYDVSMDTPFKKLPEPFRKVLLHGSGEEEISFGLWRGGRELEYKKPFEGVIPNLERRLSETDSEFTRERLREYMGTLPCQTCKSARLKPEVLACTVGGQSIDGVCRMSIRDAAEFFASLKLTAQEKQIAAEVIKEISERLRFMINVGLDYLNLNRESGSLSGGEAQRIRLATQIGSGLVGVLYVLDEPSIGLHQRDNLRLIETLKRLRDVGNTVLVVEHDEQTILEADHVVDLGPRAGQHGGEVVFSGTVPNLLKHKTSLTAQYLTGALAVDIPAKRRKPGKEWLKITGAQENNLRNVEAKIPLGMMVCVTGVSGSGKSTLVDDILRRAAFRQFYDSKEKPGKHKAITGWQHLDKVIVIDQSPIGRTPRSNPATYTGSFGLIRDLYAKLPASKARGYGPGRYSFNVKGGRCEKCQGDGMLRIEMNFLPDVYVTCEQCGGNRYNRETLEVKYAGKSIADMLNMTIEEALGFFDKIPPLARKLQTLNDVGLGYVKVGQSATTLSGGEAQRVKLATELSKRDTGKTLFILDEPTTGLHFADVHKLLEVLTRLRDAGNSLVIIEHNLDVVKTADWIIDMGPEGGVNGGTVVAEGTPEDVAKNAKSHTGTFLREILEKAGRHG